MYRTGDEGRFLRSGEIEYLGRRDEQVKVRGYRIELGEIEATLLQHESVRKAVVVADEQGNGERQLVAYVVAQEGEGVSTIGDLREFLKQKLPDYMVPSSFVNLDEIPLTGNGKIDRRALPPSIQPGAVLSDSYVAPRNLLELQLAQIWREVLGRQQVGVTDSFFELGGHSLMAIRLVARMEKHLGAQLPLAVLFQEPTIERLAKLLQQQHQHHITSSPLVPIQPGGSKTPFFCVHAASGNVFSYVELARNLGADQPFYGLQSQGLNGEPPLYSNVEEMAAEYLRAVREIQPEGPYYLGGWSMGSLVAFEMAQQLQRGGEQVALLALIEPGHPQGSRRSKLKREDELGLLVNFALHLGLSPEHLSLAPEEVEQLTTDAMLALILERAQLIKQLPSDFALPQLDRLYQVFKNNVRAARRYRARAYDGRLTIIKAGERSTAGADDPAGSWRELTNEGIDLHHVPGDHYTIISKTHAVALAERLGLCIDEAGTVNCV
jgi:thioesterase domain-containing protein/acyl carrier protein